MAYENVSGTKYAVVLSVAQRVTMIDGAAPFLSPNQEAELVYDDVGKNLTYDGGNAATVQRRNISTKSHIQSVAV